MKSQSNQKALLFRQRELFTIYDKKHTNYDNATYSSYKLDRIKGFIFEYINPYVSFSYLCYFGVLVLNVFIYTKIDYRFGVVINSLSSLFVMILSRVLLREVITKRRIYGNIIVVIGILVFTLF